MTESVPLGYTLFSVLAGPRPRTAPDQAALAELETVAAKLAGDGVTLRGLYDVTGMRAEADLMIWLHTTPGAVDDPAALQRALRALPRGTPGRTRPSGLVAPDGEARSGCGTASMRRVRGPGGRAWCVSWPAVRCRFIATSHDPVIAVVGVRGVGGLSTRDRWLGAQGSSEPGTATGVERGACVFQPRPRQGQDPLV